MLGPGMNLITTVVGFAMSITFIIFLCARLICGRVREAEAQLEMGTGFIYEPDHPAHGLEPVVVATFPTMKFGIDSFPSKEDAQCSICLGEYEEKEVLRIMPTCGHDFHLHCIDTWLKKHSTCPVCRLSLLDSIEAQQVMSSVYCRMIQSMNSSSPSDVANQWLLPTTNRSSSSGISPELDTSDAQNLETRHVR